MQRLSASQRTYLQDATTLYARAFRGSPAEEYSANRGLTDLDRQGLDPFLLGYVADPLPGHEDYAGFLAIPYLRTAADGRLSVVSIRFRCIAEDCEHSGHGKYMTLAGDRPRLYNTADLLVPSRFVVLAEGELDAIAAHRIGLPTTGFPGSNAWQPWFRDALLGYETALIPADGDKAGRKFAAATAKHLPNAKVIYLPEGEDVNSLILAEGPEAFKERLGIEAD
ncbi:MULTISPECIES: toprim domain-containing protein [Nocardia]|uniref:Toprim domain-containing protein n=1 Tax=Nocardia iowensis TaxID=204891 RepID=A0ABX8RTI9_NOCIO|nr:toprim domain-containing protein [Nocardia iowensis]QXN92591.1 toprim domain-containing protein [Nocardia iowensis]